MKKITFFNAVIIIGVLSLGLSACEPGQQATRGGAASSDNVVQAIEANRWVFIPDQMLPQRGRARMLNGGYELSCTGDSLVSYLPYFGRAYTGTYGTTKGPLDFMSTDIKYEKEKVANDKWNIAIYPNDNTEVRSMSFTFYDNGSASLDVRFANRDPISFNGSVKKKN